MKIKALKDFQGWPANGDPGPMVKYVRGEVYEVSDRYARSLVTQKKAAPVGFQKAITPSENK